MKYLLDVNGLVALGFLQHEFHERVASWVHALAYGDDQWPSAFTSRRLYYIRHSAPGSPSLVETDVRDSTALWATLHA